MWQHPCSSRHAWRTVDLTHCHAELFPGGILHSSFARSQLQGACLQCCDLLCQFPQRFPRELSDHARYFFRREHGTDVMT